MIKIGGSAGKRDPLQYFWSDDPKEACELFERGVDCILRNDYLAVKTASEKYFKKR